MLCASIYILQIDRDVLHNMSFSLEKRTTFTNLLKSSAWDLIQEYLLQGIRNQNIADGHTKSDETQRNTKPLLNLPRIAGIPDFKNIPNPDTIFSRLRLPFKFTLYTWRMRVENQDGAILSLVAPIKMK